MPDHEVPLVPEVSQVPVVPLVPGVSQVPEVPLMPEMSQVPVVPLVPEVPLVPMVSLVPEVCLVSVHIVSLVRYTNSPVISFVNVIPINFYINDRVYLQKIYYVHWLNICVLTHI